MARTPSTGAGTQPAAGVNAGRGLVERARAFCAEAHAGQTLGDRPFHEHPYAVADILRERGVTDEATLAAAYLHDVLEKNDRVTADALRDAFGGRTAELVESLTVRGEFGSMAEKHEALMAEAQRLDDAGRLIKLADRLDNLRHLERKPPEQRKVYARLTPRLVDALGPHAAAGHEMAAEIHRLVDGYLSHDAAE